MAQHVSAQQYSMFEDATKQVQKSLETLRENVRKNMLDRVDSIYLSMQRDYMSIIGKSEASLPAFP